MAATNGPRVECEKEVRFAIVMYGGVSLAIYINGVAQELLRLVRATAPASAVPPDSTDAPAARSADKLSGSERVYRKVSFLLSTQDERQRAWADVPLRRPGESEKDFQERLKDYGDAPPRAAGEDDEDYHNRLAKWWRQDRWLKQAEESLKPNADNGHIRTRFIVDIISGTSAGGINGVFLAKALANDQSIRELEQLWIDEGDIRLLINDRRSVEDPYEVQTPPASLLNSQRLYVKLLAALTDMDKDAPQPQGQQDICASPYVADLDLFVTTTDISGVRLPIKLSDRVVFERRHRNVFQFRYAADEGRNDFMKRYNPFLAYASRCTSSFPFAFEPMVLTDIDDVLKNFSMDYPATGLEGDRERWKQFYQCYLERSGTPTPNVEFASRAFGDGGYLDNRPFSYATEALARRVADVPVQRKLIYIEPSPEHPEDQAEKAGKPNVAQNIMAALFTLPRYETIREDLQRVQERNRLITRIQRILKQVNEDEARARKGGRARGDERLLEQLGQNVFVEEQDRRRRSRRHGKPLNDLEWAGLDLADMRQRKGGPYTAYLRLEIGVVTDNLADLVARALGYAADSDHYQAIRSLVRAWRDVNFAAYREDLVGPEAEGPKETINAFLVFFDVTYSLRRLIFIRDRIDHALRAPETDPEALEELRSLRPFINGEYRALLEAKLAAAVKLSAEIRATEAEANGARIKEADLDYILGVDLHPHALAATGDYVAESRNSQQEEASKRRALRLFDEKPEFKANLDGIAKKLREEIYGPKQRSDYACLYRLTTGYVRLPAEMDTAAAIEARERMLYYYRNYDEYDMLILPIQQGTDIGESALTEITRISPEDATNLIDERKKGQECFKLAGTALGHFGAFLQESWRRNDILWGRLDGAERLIAALLPDDPELAQPLITEAQAAIVCETIDKMGHDEMHGLLVESMMRIKAKRPAPETLTCYIEKLLTAKGEKNGATLERIKQKQVRDYYLKHYRKRSQLEPEPALRSAARATTVVGKMLDRLSEQYHLDNKGAMWVTRLGNVFWGLVEVAVPESLANKIFRHWLKLIYLFEALLIVSGILFQKSDLSGYGWRALGLTLVLNAAVLLLGDVMQYRPKRWRATKTILIGALTLLIGLGLIELRQLSSQLPTDWHDLQQAEPGLLLRAGALLSFIWIAVIGWMAVYSARISKLAKQQLEAEQERATEPENATAQEKKAAPRAEFMPLMRARTEKQIKEVIGNAGDERRTLLEDGLYADYFFIAVYWLLFLVMSRVLYLDAAQSVKSLPWLGIPYGRLALALGLVAAISGTVAAIADIIENRRMLKLLDLPLTDKANAPDGDPSAAPSAGKGPETRAEKQAEKTRKASRWKVAATSVTAAALAFMFLLRIGHAQGAGGWSVVIAVLLLAGALLGALGLIQALHKALGISFLLLAAGILIVAVMLTFAPHSFFAAWFLTAAAKAWLGS